MKTPTWGIVVGSLMLLFGGCSILNDIQSINMPGMIEMQQEMMNVFSEEYQTSTADTIDFYNPDNEYDSTTGLSSSVETNISGEQLNSMMKSMFYVSEFTKIWVVRLAYMGLIISFIYMLSGLFLLLPQKFTLILLYSTLILSVIFGIFKVIMLSVDASGSFLSMSMGFSQVFGIFIDIILLIVVSVADKTPYKKNQISSEVQMA